jgi:hypothetical protein
MRNFFKTGKVTADHQTSILSLVFVGRSMPKVFGSDMSQQDNSWKTVAGKFKPIEQPVSQNQNLSQNSFKALSNHEDQHDDDQVTNQPEDDNGLSYDESEQVSEPTTNSNVSVHTNTSNNDSVFQKELPLSTCVILKKIDKIRSEGKNISENASMNEILLWIDTKSEHINMSHQQHMKDMDKLSQVAKHTTSTCEGMSQAMKQCAAKLKDAIATIEEDAISTINKVSNCRIEEILNTLDEFKELESKIHQSQSIPADILKQIYSTKKQLDHSLENIFNHYNETVGNMIDHEKESLKNWLTQIMANNDAFCSIRDLVNETAKLKASHLLLD